MQAKKELKVRETLFYIDTENDRNRIPNKKYQKILLHNKHKEVSLQTSGRGWNRRELYEAVG